MFVSWKQFLLCLCSYGLKKNNIKNQFYSNFTTTEIWPQFFKSHQRFSTFLHPGPSFRAVTHEFVVSYDGLLNNLCPSGLQTGKPITDADVVLHVQMQGHVRAYKHHTAVTESTP